MAQAMIGSDFASNASATSLDCVMTAAVQIGDTIVVCLKSGGSNPTAPTDTLGSTYTRIVHETVSSQFEMYWATAASSCAANGNTVNTTSASAARLGLSVYHLRGMAASPADRATAVGTFSAATSSATAAFTTTQANEIIIGMWGASATPTPEADYGGANDEGDGTARFYTCHRIATGILTDETVDWTHSSASGNCAAASFKEAAAGGGNPHHAYAQQ